MLRHTLPLLSALLLCSSSAIAQQGKTAPAGKILPPPLRNAPIIVVPQRDQIRDAFTAAERGTLSSEQMAALANHPLVGWVEYAQLKRDIDTLPVPRGQAFLAKYKGQALEGAFRDLWLAALSRREDWPAFRSAWSSSIKDGDLRCAELEARAATGNTDAKWVADAQAMWRSTGKPLPAACDAPFAML